MNQQTLARLNTLRDTFSGVVVEVLQADDVVLVACVPHPREPETPGATGDTWVEVCEPFFMLVGPDREEKRAPVLRVVGSD